MSEEAAVVEQPQTPPASVETIIPAGNLFSDESWSTQPPVVATPPKAEDGGSTVPAKDAPAPKTDDSEIVDEHEYLERQTGYKSWDEVKAAKTELEQLRAKPQTAAERKFANEESKKLAEAWEAGETDKVFEYLDTQRQLKKAADLSAADAIKLHLKQSNPHYKSEDIEDVFEERYSVPKKPAQGVNEEKEEFDERLTEYNTRVAKVNRAIERDAVAAKQDLAKRITELVPPEIPQREQVNQGPSQEVLDGRKAYVENYRKAVPKEIENFKGFTTTFKDEAVEIPISYAVTPEEVKEFQTELEAFADANLDVNTLFSKDWVNPDGTINIRRVAEDRYLLKNRDKIFQKIANESASKRLAHQIKLNSNIHVNGGKIPTTEIKKDENAEMLEHFWKNT